MRQSKVGRNGSSLATASYDVQLMFALYYMTGNPLSLHSFRRVARRLGFNWSYTTVKRRFARYGKREEVFRSLSLSPNQRSDRLAHARRLLQDPLLMANVIYSDEKIFIVNQSGPRWVWSLDGASRGNRIPTKKWHRQVMVWAAAGLRGQNKFFVVPSGTLGTVTATTYVEVIRRGVLPLMEEHPHCWFQQDNAKSHVAGGPLRILRKKGCLLEPWPANSPDLSGIEFIWARMVGLLNLVEDWTTHPSLEDVLHAIFLEVVTDESYMIAIWETVLQNLQYVVENNGQQR